MKAMSYLDGLNQFFEEYNIRVGNSYRGNNSINVIQDFHIESKTKPPKGRTQKQHNLIINMNKRKR